MSSYSRSELFFHKSFNGCSISNLYYLFFSISGDSHAVNLDYLQSLKNSIVNPLIVKGNNGVDESVKFMVDYNLVREDLDHILELSTWPGIKDSFSNVDSKVS